MAAPQNRNPAAIRNPTASPVREPREPADRRRQAGSPDRRAGGRRVSPQEEIVQVEALCDMELAQQGSSHQGTSRQEEHKDAAPALSPQVFLANSGVQPTVWNFSKQVSKWKSQAKALQFEEIIQDPDYKEYLRAHELEFKAKLPFPLITAMEQEVLDILEVTIKDYYRYLGPQHNMTQQMRQRIHSLKQAIEQRGVLDEQEQRRPSIFRFFRRLLGKS